MRQLNKNTETVQAVEFHSKEEITLGVLSAVEEDSRITQRSIASELGIALGLANSYLKRCVDKGLVKIQQVPRNRYAYYLTPRGFTEKARLTADYLKFSFHFFRRSRKEFENIFENCIKENKTKILFSDISEVSEIAILSSLDKNIEIVGVIGKGRKRFSGAKVILEINETLTFDYIVITSIINPQSQYKKYAALLGAQRVVFPEMLSIDNNKEASN